MTIQSIGSALHRFFKKEAVLCLSFLAAVLLAFFVPPDSGYLDYLDTRVLILLFCLMAVVSGLREAGILARISSFFLRRASSSRRLGLLFILLCFFSSMLLTNDVALLTFVPLCMGVMQAACPSGTAITVVLMTIAANLGSMATPVGNPQNLYLYGRFSLEPGAFFTAVLPVVGVSLVLLLLSSLLIPSRSVQVDVPRNEPIAVPKAGLFGGLLLLSILAVLRVLPAPVLLGITVVALLVFSRRTFLKVDWCLLLTFVCFFVFVGNLGRIEAVAQAAANLTAGNELWCGLVLSQVISNVPAAMMLAPFSQNGCGLLLGTDIGGLGTLVASLASLISYKLYIARLPGENRRYLGLFTVLNVAFLVPLILLAMASGWT